MLKMFASLLCAFGLFLSATFVPTVASASTVNYELASDPTAVMAKIDAMNLEPLSPEMAREMRGEGYLLDWADYFRSIAGAFGVSAAVGACVWVTGGVCGVAVAAAGGYFLFTGYVLGPLSEAVYMKSRF